MTKLSLECKIFAYSLFKGNVWDVNLCLPSPICRERRPKVLKNLWQPGDHELAVLVLENAILCLECSKVVSIYSHAALSDWDTFWQT